MGKTDAEEEDEKSAVEEVAISIVSFDPFKFLRTFQYILTNQNKIVDAITKQNWDKILSPTKYFSACVAILGLGIWLYLDLYDFSAWSPQHPFIYQFFIFQIFPFLLVQYVYVAAASPTKMAATDVLAKLFQCYAMITGSTLALIGVCFTLMYARSVLDKANLTVPGDAIIVLTAAAAVLLIWVAIGSLRIIAKLCRLGIGTAFMAIILGIVAAIVGGFFAEPAPGSPLARILSYVTN